MRAPGKVNLCLLVGAPRADGLHPLVSLVQPTDLADILEVKRPGRLTSAASARTGTAASVATQTGTRAISSETPT